VVLAAAAATGAGLLVIDGDGDRGGDRTGDAATSRPAPPHPSARPGSGHTASEGHRSTTRDAVRRAVRESGSPPLDPGQERVAEAVRAYVAALAAHDGPRGCALFARGALAGFEFPRDRGGCAASLAASIGYRDPAGFPVYESSRVARIPRVVIEGSAARVTATTVTRFADRREPSVEDDVIYLRDEGGRWRIAKPSATLYRAVGIGEIPPRALAAPSAPTG
jgi:hypothetical protein